MTIKEYIDLVNARLVPKGKHSNSKVLVVTVIGMPPDKQRELEAFAYKYKNDIVRELLKTKRKEMSYLSLEEELHFYYVAKQQDDEYKKLLARYKNNESTYLPQRPEKNLDEEYGKLSERARAYLKADSYVKYGTGKKKAAGEKAKQEILSLEKASDSEYIHIIEKMEAAVKGRR